MDLENALAGHTGPLLLVADHDVFSPALASAADNDGAAASAHMRFGELTARFCQFCGPDQFLLIGTRLDALAVAYRGPLAEALMFRRAILLDPEPADGLRLGVQLPRRGRPAPPGRGFLIRDGLVRPLQVALTADSGRHRDSAP